MSRLFHVAKFGGTSLGTSERVQRAVQLAVETAQESRRVVVCSAFGGVTDRLLDAIDTAVNDKGDHEMILDGIRERHLTAIDELALPTEVDGLSRKVQEHFKTLADLFQDISQSGNCPPRLHDAIVSFGERLAAPIVAAAFRNATSDAIALDASSFIRTNDTFGEGAIDFSTTESLIKKRFETIPDDTIAVVTGFVASTKNGAITTLGRSGSDYTATLIAGALDAKECVIWTDVDGVLSADPRIVSEAFTLPALSYEEAAELAHFGSKVLHPRTMLPLQKAGIPLIIRNTLNPTSSGTRIGPEQNDSGRIKGITAVRDLALIRIMGAALLDVHDLSARVFGTLREEGIPVSLIAQASAEGNLCVAVRSRDVDHAATRLRETLALEIDRGEILDVKTEKETAIVAAVGNFSRDAPGLTGRMFNVLSKAHVSVRAIAQGASDHQIAAAIPDETVPNAVEALHESFALRHLRAHLIMIGAGTLGRNLLQLLDAQKSTLREQGIHLRLTGIANSRGLLLEPAGLSTDEALRQLDDASSYDLYSLASRLTSLHLERLIVVDATSSEKVASVHADLLRAGIGVVTPNKAARTRSLEQWKDAKHAAREGEAPYFYDSTVGAGLGILPRLRDLLRTGDRIHRIEGVLSGTLSFVLHELGQGTPFSEAVRNACDAGLTEPDPRDDLTGRDLAHKVALLGREMGLNLNPSDVKQESLLPEEWEGIPLETFWRRLPERDGEWSDRTEWSPVQMVARLEEDGATASVESVGTSSNNPFSKLARGEVAVAFHTDRYNETPLVLRGPGASVEITTSVLLADIVRAAEALR